MYTIKLFCKNLFISLFFVACLYSNNKLVNSEKENSLITRPILLAEWNVGTIHDIAWHPNSKIFSVNYWIDGDNSNSYVQSFDLDLLNSKWLTKNSLAFNIGFTPDGLYTIESNVFAPFFYWRDIESGEIIYQVEDRVCNGGGQILIINSSKNNAWIMDINNLLGPNTNNVLVIRRLNLENQKCENLLEYQGSFDLFDLNSNGTLMAFGGEGDQDSVVIWDVKKSTEVCRTPTVEYGFFVPNENTLIVTRDKKIFFVDANTCQETRELNVSPALDYENYIDISPDGKLISIATDGIEIVDALNGKLLTKLPFPKNSVPIESKLFINGIKFSPDGNYLLVSYYLLEGINNGLIQVWELKP